MKFFLIPFMLLLLYSVSYSQEEGQHTVEHEPIKHHQIGILIGHSHISHGATVEGRQWEVLPSWGFFYNYKFNEKWGIGMHADIIVETFEVERHLSGGESDEILVRKNPIAPAILGIYQPTHHSSFVLGFGFEYASDETFSLVRLGYEWSTPISDKWELVVPISYDLRLDAYDVWFLGVGVSRVF